MRWSWVIQALRWLFLEPQRPVRPNTWMGGAELCVVCDDHNPQAQRYIKVACSSCGQLAHAFPCLPLHREACATIQDDYDDEEIFYGDDPVFI